MLCHLIYLCQRRKAFGRAILTNQRSMKASTFPNVIIEQAWELLLASASTPIVLLQGIYQSWGSQSSAREAFLRPVRLIEMHDTNAPRRRLSHCKSHTMLSVYACTKGLTVCKCTELNTDLNNDGGQEHGEFSDQSPS